MRDRSYRLWILWCGALLAAGIVGAGEPAPPAQTAPTGPAPHIKFDSEEIDLGDVVHGQDAVATFTYRNSGTVPLHILAAKPG